MKINQWIIILIVLLGGFACQPNKAEPIEITKAIDTSQATTPINKTQTDDHTDSDFLPIQYKNALLVLGGSPSLSIDLQPANLYSYRLEKFLTKEYHIINAAIANERNEQFFRRLPILLQHESNAIIIELGADEVGKQIDPSSFSKKVSTLLEMLHQKKEGLPIFIIPSTTKSSYLEVIKTQASALPNIKIIPPAEFSPLSAEWHEFIARQLAKQLDEL